MASDRYTIWPGFDLEASRDVQTVDNSRNVLDKQWRFIDEAGHGHFIGDDDTLPTLEWVHEGCDMGHGDDCDGGGHWECKLCCEEVVPRVYWKMDSVSIPGPTTFTVTEHRKDGEVTYVFGEDTWNELQDRSTALIREILEPRITYRTWRNG